MGKLRAFTVQCDTSWLAPFAKYLDPVCIVHRTACEVIMTYATDRILRLKTVLERTGLSRATMYRKMQNGTFPKNIRISERCMGWRESSVAKWLRNPMLYKAADQHKRTVAPDIA